jgi:hypothetical protein
MSIQDTPGWWDMTPEERMAALIEHARNLPGVPFNSGTFPDPCADERDWWVEHCTYREGWLALRCKHTGARGAIKDPTPEEWSAAYEAPYPFPEPWRVVLMGGNFL